MIDKQTDRLIFKENQLSHTTLFADVPEGHLPNGATRLYIRRDSGMRSTEYMLSYMYPAVGERAAPAPYDQRYANLDAAKAAAHEWTS